MAEVAATRLVPGFVDQVARLERVLVEIVQLVPAAEMEAILVAIGHQRARRVAAAVVAVEFAECAVAPRGAAFDHDQVQAKPGEVLLLATDGIETRSSGIELADITPVLRGPGTLQQRLRTLQALCDRPQTGGGKDNLGLVAIEFASDAD